MDQIKYLLRPGNSKGKYILLPGEIIIGDNAHIHWMYMAASIKGQHIVYKDACNVYLLQSRITIECNFGVFVHH